MTEKPSALKNLVFISLPPNMERDIGSFHIDSSVEIPVQLPEGKKTIDSSIEISIELIVSGMLKILAYQPEHRHASYYREFVLNVQPDAVEELNLAAIAQEQKQNFDFAEELFLAVCHLSKQSAAYINLATLYNRRAALDTGKGTEYDFYVQKALDTLKQGVEAVGEDAPLLSELGFFHLYQGNVELAKEYLDKYLAIAPEDEKSKHISKIMQDIDLKLNDDRTLMQAYDEIQLNKEEAALALLDVYLGHNPKVWNAWFLKGWALRRLGEYLEAEKALVSALSYTEGSSDIYNELALCGLETGKRELAKTYLNTAVDLDPENITLLSNLAYLHLQDWQWDEAREFLELARIIDGKDPLIQQLMQDYERETGEQLSNPVVQEFIDAEQVKAREKGEKPFFIEGKEDTDDLSAEFTSEDD